MYEPVSHRPVRGILAGGLKLGVREVVDLHQLLGRYRGCCS